MNPKLIAIALAAVAAVGFGATLPAAERAAWKFTEIEPKAATPHAVVPDAGSISVTTGEELTGSSLYFVAHVERADGGVDPAYGTNPRGVFLFRTASGSYVLRIVEIPESEFAWRATN